MKKQLLFTIILLIFFLSSHAQWSMDPSVNTPVCTASGNQIDIALQNDEVGGVFIAWKDYRNGLPDIFVQRLNKQGYPLWTLDGIGACTDAADQSTPEMVSDGRGGLIVAWSDWRSSIERDIYCQRIDSNGVPQWTPDGVVVTNKTNREHSEKIVSDGAGGAIIQWEEQVSGATWDIRLQRISYEGVALWQAGGINVVTIGGHRINGRLKKDGQGGAIVVWQDLRSTVDYDIYAQRVDGNGSLLWGVEGKPVCTATGTQNNVKIEFDNTNNGAFITWVDKRSGTLTDIYSQRLDQNGNPLWVNDGVPVCTAIGTQSALDMSSSYYYSGLVVTWKDERNGNYDIYAQKLSLNGSPKWDVDGVPVCTNISEQLNPNIVDDYTGGNIITWQDFSTGDWNIMAQRIDSSGNMLWTTNGVPVCTASGTQTGPKNLPDGYGGSIFAWEDSRAGNGDIYAHHLFATGSPNYITEIEKSADFYVYPNPTQTKVTFKVSKNLINFDLNIYNIQGKLIKKIILNSTQTTIDIGDFESGLYFVKVQGDNQTLIRKIVVE